MQRILIVDDEPAIRDVLAERLQRDGFDVRGAGEGEAALAWVRREPFAAAVLDVGLPDMDGFEVLRTLRAEGYSLPVIILTARGDEIDRVVGLELGADDYVVKPFSPRELVARLRALLRRTATFHGVPLDLRPREFDLLATLAAHPDQVWSREALLMRVWGTDEHIDARTVDVHVRRLRAKLADIDAADQPIQTDWGVGYRFVSAERRAQSAEQEGNQQ